MDPAVRPDGETFPMLQPWLGEDAVEEDLAPLHGENSRLASRETVSHDHTRKSGVFRAAGHELLGTVLGTGAPLGAKASECR